MIKLLNEVKILLITVLLLSTLLISGCFPQQITSSVNMLEFSNEDLKLCYSDAFRDLDSRAIVNRDYVQMASNFNSALKLRSSNYTAGDAKSKRQIYQALDLDSKRKLITALAGISCNYVIQGEHQEAFNILEPVDQLLSAQEVHLFPEVAVALGFIESKRGNYSSAIKNFSKVIDVGKDDKSQYAEALYGRALVYLDREHHEKSKEDLVKKANLDLTLLVNSKIFTNFPFPLETYWTLGRASLRQASYENNSKLVKSAIDAFINAINSDIHIPSHHLGDVYDSLGTAYMMQKNYEKAIESFRKALERTGLRCDSPFIYLHLGEALLRKGDYLEGAKHCRLAQINGLNAGLTDAKDCIGEYYINLGNKLEENLDSEVEKLKSEECGKVSSIKFRRSTTEKELLQ